MRTAMLRRECTLARGVFWDFGKIWQAYKSQPGSTGRITAHLELDEAASGQILPDGVAFKNRRRHGAGAASSNVSFASIGPPTADRSASLREAGISSRMANLLNFRMPDDPPGKATFQ
jgi:hypothetical protein